MTEKASYIAYLLHKQLFHTLDAAEKAKLQAWLNEDQRHVDLARQFEDSKFIGREVDLFLQEEARSVWDNPVLVNEMRHASKSTKWARLQRYAALLLLACLMTIWISDTRNHTGQVTQTMDAFPGGNRAILTLSNGQEIDLNRNHSGVIISGSRLHYQDGTDVFTEPKAGLESLDGLPRGESQLMSIATPRGGIYQITLSDGTKVWLNAGTVLRYPSQFEKTKRVVELEGEAYFEVNRSPSFSGIPFKVISRGQEVEVLGTTFNISSYFDEPEVKTTLVTGSIKVWNSNSKETTVLKPGKQSIVSGDNTVVNTVDRGGAIAWKDGYFDFTDVSLGDVIRQLARWYDLEIVVQGSIPFMEFYGRIERNNRLSTVMALLESNSMAYRWEGRKLIIWYKEGGNQ